jgi:hypothetical protein
MIAKAKKFVYTIGSTPLMVRKEVAAWLKEKQAPAAASRRMGSPRVAA